MKFLLQGTAFFALFISQVAAEKSGVFAANGVELEVYTFEGDVMIGESVSTQVSKGSYIIY